MITANDIKKGEITSDGSPFYRVSASSDIKPNTLQLSLNGSPWYGVGGGTIETIISGHVKRILKVEWPYVKTVIGAEG